GVEAESLVSPLMPDLRPTSELEIMGRGSSSSFSGSQQLSQMDADDFHRSTIAAGDDASRGEPVSRFLGCPSSCVLPSIADEYGASGHKFGGICAAVGQMIPGEKGGGELPTVPVSSPVLCHDHRIVGVDRVAVAELVPPVLGASTGDFFAVAEQVHPVQPMLPTVAEIPGDLLSAPDSAPQVLGGPVAVGDSHCCPEIVISSLSLVPLLVADLCRVDGDGMVREEGRDPRSGERR
ncbi:hypothetical protein Dimus_037701, partial [Dionaea muscipula]